MDTPNGRAQITQLFGSPALSSGQLNHAWEGANIRNVPPPDGWRLFYQSDDGLVHTSSIRMHKLLADSFTAVLDDVWDRAKTLAGNAASDDDVRSYLHQHRLDLHGGGYNFRPITGGTGLSMHAYGIAIDWDPIHNPRQKPLKRTLEDWWYQIWADHGWSNGQHFSTPDPMHVQFATGA